MIFRLQNTLLASAILTLCACGGSSGAGGGYDDGRPDFGSQAVIRVQPPLPQQQAEIQTVLAETNRLRAEKGLPPLRLNKKLSAYAQVRAQEVSKSFSHQRLNGESFGSGLYYGIGEHTSGENIAGGNPTGAKTVGQWRNSPTHYDNIINGNFSDIGIGLIHVPGSRYGHYWVQIFSTGDGVDSRYRFAETLKVGLMRQGDNGFRQPAQQFQQSGDSFDYVVVDGVALPMGNPGDSFAPLQAEGYGGLAAGGKDSRYGVAGRQGGRWHAFYQGVPTEKMPTAGKAQYRGHGLMANGVPLAAQFEADFGGRTLNGRLSENGNARFDIQTDIRGNTFASPRGAKVAAEGGFFGDDAAEMAGVFRDTSSGTGGAFGGKRQ